MSVVLDQDTGVFRLSSDYEINFVNLSKVEKCHTHQFAELVYTISGNGIHIVDGQEYHVKSGDLLIINYHRRHEVRPLENLYYCDIMLQPEYINETLKGTEDLFLLLQLGDFSDLSNEVVRDHIFLHLDAEEQKKMEFLLNWTAKEQKEQMLSGKLICRSALHLILSMVFREMARKQQGPLPLNAMLLTYLKENCHEKLSVDEIASQCGYSATYFSRLFKKYTGVAPVKYLANCRIEKAQQLLTQTSKTVEAIMEECGYTNRTAFFKAFTQKHGCTPLQYRKVQK